MNPRKFAMVGGWVMLLMGVLALIPAFYTPQGSTDLPMLNVTSSYSLAFGIFPMNIFNKIALILFGLAGIGASRERGGFDSPEGNVVGGNGWSTGVAEPHPSSVLWSRVVCVMMGALAVLGLFRTTNTLFGVWPLFGAEVGAHGVFALLGAYFGFADRTRGAVGHTHHHRHNVHSIRRAG